MAKHPAPKSEPWRNRIAGHAEVDPRTLEAHPGNWRKHPQPQADALTGVLNDVGWVQSVIVNQRTDRIIDGHLRVAEAVKRGQPSIPVVYVDLSEAEEAEILATFDPLGAMAEADAAALDALLGGVSSEDEAVTAMLAMLAEESGLYQNTGTEERQSPDDFKEVGEDIETEHTCPKCGYAWSGGK